ncbi:MAG: hypothetical protein Q9186_000488 [Xanthomendoza sp. 1 TL-2023]
MHEIYTSRDDISLGLLRRLSIKELISPADCGIQFEARTEQVKHLPLSEVLLGLEPGCYLQHVPDPIQGKGDANRINTYRMAPIPGIWEDPQPRITDKSSVYIKPLNYVRAGRTKELHLTSATSSSGYELRLQQSYNHLLCGSRVELHVHLDKKDVGRQMTIDAVIARSPHLRPEAIIGAMPKRTVMMYGPFWESGAQQLMWVMANEGNWLKGTAVTGWSFTLKQKPKGKALEVLKNLPRA